MRWDLERDTEHGGLAHLLGDEVGLPHEPVGPDDVLAQFGQAPLKSLVPSKGNKVSLKVGRQTETTR